MSQLRSQFSKRKNVSGYGSNCFRKKSERPGHRGYGLTLVHHAMPYRPLHGSHPLTRRRCRRLQFPGVSDSLGANEDFIGGGVRTVYSGKTSHTTGVIRSRRCQKPCRWSAGPVIYIVLCVVHQRREVCGLRTDPLTETLGNLKIRASSLTATSRRDDVIIILILIIYLS